MGGVAIVGPLFPTDVQLLHEESFLCQLQSRFRGGLSIVSPTVGDDFLVPGQKRGELFQFVYGRTECTGDVSAGEGIFAAGIEEDEIEVSVLDRV